MLCLMLAAVPIPPYHAMPPPPPPQRPPTPLRDEVQDEVEVTRIEKDRVIFEDKGLVFRELTYAHVYTHVDFNRVVSEFNLIVNSLNDAHDKVLVAGKLKSSNGKATAEKIDTFVNTSFFQIKEQLSDAQDEMSLLCELIACEESIDDPMELLPRNASRKKRQIDVALGIVSVGLSIYNLAETQALKQELFSEEKEVNHIAHELAAQQQVIAALEKHMEVVDRELHALSEQETRVQFEQSVSLISAFLFRAAERLLWFSRSITTIVLEKKLGPRIFEVRALQKAIQALEGEAKVKGMTLVSTCINDVVQESVSFVAEKGIIYFMLHLPVGVGEALRLYRYVSVPFLQPDGKAVRIPSNIDLIAVNRQLDQMLELTLNELKSCIKRGANHLCKKGVVRKDITNSCLGALFMGHGPQAVDRCTISVLNLTHELMIQTGERSVILFVPPEISAVHVYVTCGNLEPRQFTVTGSNKVKVAHGCSISTTFWAFQASIGAPVESAFSSRPLLEFKMPLLREENLTSTVEIEDWIPEERENPTNLRPIPHHPHYGYVGLLSVGLFLFTLILAAAGYVVFRIKRADWRRSRGRRTGGRDGQTGKEAPEASAAGFKPLGSQTRVLKEEEVQLHPHGLPDNDTEATVLDSELESGV